MSAGSYKLPDKHFCFTICPNVHQICEPLFRHFSLSYFSFARFYHDGSVVLLTSSPILLDNLDQVSATGVSKSGVFAKPGVYLQDDIEDILLPASQFAFRREQLLLDHALYMFERYEHYHDQIYIAAHPDVCGLNELYLSQIELFERFLLYFRDKAEKLIEEASYYPVQVPMTNPHVLMEARPAIRDAFLKDIEHKRYFMRMRDGGLYISKRELDVLTELSRGRAIKEAASKLALSPRTVEYYLKNVKDKMGCFSRSQVIDTFLASKLADLNFVL